MAEVVDYERPSMYTHGHEISRPSSNMRLGRYPWTIVVSFQYIHCEIKDSKEKGEHPISQWNLHSIRKKSKGARKGRSQIKIKGADSYD